MNRIHRPFVLSVVAVCAASFALAPAALAQAGAGTAAPPPKKPGVMARIKNRLTGNKQAHGAPTTAATAAAGQIIGNKQSKVYHLAGSGGNLPALKNRVYFKTEAEAQAAGYHKAGVGGKKPATGAAKSGPARDPKTGKFIKKSP